MGTSQMVQELMYDNIVPVFKGFSFDVKKPKEKQMLVYFMKNFSLLMEEDFKFAVIFRDIIESIKLWITQFHFIFL